MSRCCVGQVSCHAFRVARNRNVPEDSIVDTLRAFLIVALAGSVAACAAHPDPIIDMQGVDETVFAADWQDCEGYSEEVVIGKGIAKGAGVGGGVGALGGAVDGDVGRGAAAGALIGATRSGLDADRDKQRVFKRCMRGRGYRVLN